MKIYPKNKKSTLIEWRNALVFAVVFATLFRWSLAEAFVIPTGSMENSLLVGDYILVSKIHYGARTPKTPLQLPLSHQKIWGTEIPSYLDWIQLPSYRLPGLRQVERGETVVFNTPKDLLDPKDRPMDLMTYLVKRCVAVPGDVLEIRERQLFINEEKMTNPPGLKFLYQVVTEYPLQPNHLVNVGLDSNDYSFLGYDTDKRMVYNIFLTGEQLKKIKKAPYLVSMGTGSDSPGGFPLFPAKTNPIWNLNQYGPLTIPHKEMNIQVNEITMDYYGELIEKYEGLENVTITKGKLEIDGKTMSNYTFTQDYFFMMGDSRDNSIDSRYYGFVPESHIVGKPVMVLFSKNADGEGLNRIRWGRIFSSIH